MAMGAQAEHEMIAVDALDRRLAGVPRHRARRLRAPHPLRVVECRESAAGACRISRDWAGQTSALARHEFDAHWRADFQRLPRTVQPARLLVDVKDYDRVRVLVCPE